MKISELLRRDISPFLYGAIMSRIMTETVDGKPNFYVYTSFRSSKIVPQRLFDLRNYYSTYIDELNYFSGINNWKIKSQSETNFEARLYFENDLNLTPTAFYNMIHSKLFQCAWIREEGLTDNKKDFIRGFLELRGSVDTTAKYIAQDYFFHKWHYSC